MHQSIAVVESLEISEIKSVPDHPSLCSYRILPPSYSPVSLLEEEVVSDERVLHFLGHAIEGVVGSLPEIKDQSANPIIDTHLELSVLDVVEDLLHLACNYKINYRFTRLP